MKSIIILSFLFMILSSFSRDNNNAEKTAEKAITADDYGRHIGVLASDEFQGRQPSTIGEEKTINYLKDEFKKLGLLPGNEDSYFQQVPLVKIKSTVNKQIKIEGNGKTTTLNWADDFVATTPQTINKVSIDNAELIFAGYGIVAPEYNWNDYAGINVKNKIVVVLVNDPGYATGNHKLFNGKAMTYYGRWTYKYEEAARQGAAGIFIIHETNAASYPWAVVRNGGTGAQYYLNAADKNLSKCKMEGWITTAAAKKIIEQSGQNYKQLLAASVKRNFKSFSLGLKTSITLTNTINYSTSNNVAALWPGSQKKNEYIIYSAHWDHFGIDTTIKNADNIFHGARDNASGTAALLEIAKAFTKLPQRQERSILFLAVTGEEQGLLGSAYYGNHPIYPLAKTVADINMDGMNIFGRTKDVTVIGYGNSQLDEYVKKAADEQHRIVLPDPEPERGGFFRSDHFSFAKHGVPSLYAKGGMQDIKHGEKWGREQNSKWINEYYHKPADKYEPAWWNLSGAVEDMKLLFNVGYMLSMESSFPDWHDGSEFKAIRDSCLKNQ